VSGRASGRGDTAAATGTGRGSGGALPPVHEERATLHERVQASPEFVALRRRLRGFVFPVTAAFLLWYLAYVLLASYARELMATPVLGAVNLGLVIGLAQFASTFAVTTAYAAFARRRLDPLAATIRAHVETDQARSTVFGHGDENRAVRRFGRDIPGGPASSLRPAGGPR
jgi:uncharacterized membrane protein (DUF485 family)